MNRTFWQSVSSTLSFLFWSQDCQVSVSTWFQTFFMWENNWSPQKIFFLSVEEEEKNKEKEIIVRMLRMKLFLQLFEAQSKKCQLNIIVSFLSAFIFVLTRSTTVACKRVKVKPKHNYVLFKGLLLGLFLCSWSSFLYIYVGKACNAKPTSTLLCIAH